MRSAGPGGRAPGRSGRGCVGCAWALVGGGAARPGEKASFPAPAVAWCGVGAYGVEWASGRRGVGWLCGYEKVARDRVRAIPAASAPSHMYETWCHAAQTCLIIKEVGPERSRNNVSDPI